MSQEGVRVVGRRGSRRLGWSVDVLGVVAASVVVVVALNADTVRAALDGELAFRVLTLTAAAVGAAAAILGLVFTRLAGEPRTSWIAAALVLYCVVVLPWSTVGAADLDVVHRASRLVAYLGALVLLVLSVRPPRLLRAWGGWLVVGVTGLLAVATLGLRDGPVLRWLVEGPLLTVAVLVGWTVAAVAFVVDGRRRGSRPRTRLGLGLVVLAAAQLYRVAVAPPAPATDLGFAALRLLGLVVVLVALARLTSRALGTLASEQWRQQEELSVAALHMERAQELAAERDHELRNGLAGLAGITHLLSSDAGGADHERLRHAVLAELGRLHAILDGGAVAGQKASGQEASGTYLVEPVLAGLVTLRRTGEVSLTVPDGLAARGDPAVLAQIVTNLLANCDRHAPGAAVAVRARPDGDQVVVEVRDEGPGLPSGEEEAVLDRGVRDEAAGGSGLGLDISRRLVATQGGSLTLRTVTDPDGCLATVIVLSAQADEPTAVVGHR